MLKLKWSTKKEVREKSNMTEIQMQIGEMEKMNLPRDRKEWTEEIMSEERKDGEMVVNERKKLQQSTGVESDSSRLPVYLHKNQE